MTLGHHDFRNACRKLFGASGRTASIASLAPCVDREVEGQRLGMMVTVQILVADDEARYFREHPEASYTDYQDELRKRKAEIQHQLEHPNIRPKQGPERPK
jgi:hypothetical protein